MAGTETRDRRGGRWLWAGLALVASGVALTFVHAAIVGDGLEDTDLERYVLPFLADGALQVGSLLVLVCAAAALLRRLAPESAERRLAAARGLLPRIALFFTVLLVTGEVAVRITFPDGMSFGNDVGAIVRHFRRDFRFNGYPGPSRGPVAPLPHREVALRVLVQGDSVTWGMGVKAEADLFPARVLAGWRERRATDMTVLCQPGREIDGHLRALRVHGDVLAPDLIVYQFFVNDLELETKDSRPTRKPFRLWRKLFFHRVLEQASFAWDMMDMWLDWHLPPEGETYASYMRRFFEGDTEHWALFEAQFRAWVEEARAHTDRVCLVSYPYLDGKGKELDALETRVEVLATELGVEVVRVFDVLGDLEGDYAQSYATPYDSHPSAAIHGRIATQLDEHVRARWPELFAD